MIIVMKPNATEENLARVKEKIRSISSLKAKEVLADVLKMEDGDEIKAYLQKVL